MVKEKFGTHEWADASYNVTNGCSHDCRYCYAKAMAARFGRIAPAEWHNEQQKQNLPHVKKTNGTVMFPTAHDITPHGLHASVDAIRENIDAGNDLLIVTKPHLDCVDAMTNLFIDFKDRILFRFTIGSAADSVLSFWEPGAPLFTERLKSLMLAYQRGYKTSVSCEPMLDTKIEDVVHGCLAYVTDSIWIGKPNFLVQRLVANGESETVIAAGKKLLKDLSDDFIYGLVSRLQGCQKIKWKESISKMLSCEVTA